MQICMADPEIRSKKEAQKYIQNTANNIRGKSIDSIREYVNANLDEKAILEEAKPFLEKELKCEIIVYSADETNVKDPNNISRRAEPERPAIFIDVHGDFS